MPCTQPNPTSTMHSGKLSHASNVGSKAQQGWKMAVAGKTKDPESEKVSDAHDTCFHQLSICLAEPLALNIFILLTGGSLMGREAGTV